MKISKISIFSDFDPSPIWPVLAIPGCDQSETFTDDFYALNKPKKVHHTSLTSPSKNITRNYGGPIGENFENFDFFRF